MISGKNPLKDFDKILIVAVFLIFFMGLMAVYSATEARELPFTKGFVFRQIGWMLIGVIFLIICAAVSYQKFIDGAYVIYGANLLLLMLVLVLGHVRLGAQRWFSIMGFAFQPSEFMKISFILALSSSIAARKDDIQGLRSLLTPSLLLAMPLLMVMAQPDLGTALLLVPIFFSLLLVGGANLRYIIGMIVLGLLGLPLFWHFLRDYQKQRLLVFINPNLDPLGAGYTIIQSKIAIGSGGLLGKGWLNGTQTQLNFLPERHTDFIFSVIGEEWGFLGAAVLVILYFLVIKKALDIASATTDPYGKFIATGIAVMFAVQVIVNISMTIGLMPVVGIPLPFVSYGGSSLMANFIAVGLLLNIGMRRSTF